MFRHAPVALLSLLSVLCGLSRAAQADDSLLAVVAPTIEHYESMGLEFVPTVPRGPLTVNERLRVDDVRRLGGGSSLVFRFIELDQTIAAFKPAQTRMQTSYRGEIAGDRLCDLIGCAFEIPRNREVRILADDMRRMLGADTFDSVRSELVYSQEEGEIYVYGTANDWVPEFDEFEIETRSAWTPLVTVGATQPADIAQLISDLIDIPRDQLSPGDASLTSDQLATQISDLHVFDYLSNNWDRYSRVYPGVNCQWNDGHFISIDNGAGFTVNRTSPNRTVQRNFDQIERFSFETIHAVRELDADATFAELFPPTERHPEEKALFDEFWGRRKLLLVRVGTLRDQYGSDVWIGEGY
ncbi:MAG: hypothetical protein ACJAYU_000223 [Bradymonadia bacterium]|jgi:hypothetical protein